MNIGACALSENAALRGLCSHSCQRTEAAKKQTQTYKGLLRKSKKDVMGGKITTHRLRQVMFHFLFVEVKRTGTKGELKDQKPCVMAAIIKDNAAEEEEKTVTISFLLYKRNLLCVKAEADVLCAASRGL
ncbi:hypothetical protein Cadr_000024209 [Camelus dromedarius]|uniref:Uncharacterized protein n=1 Tax=Camelus dromedarius TaxID=9838 RepID=A0A5N4CN93_CAMDR|nr:hypothetical protein Cadr_000024209 [Camelus dromedarius]